MGIFSNLIDKGKAWIFGIALRKAISRVVAFALAWLGSVELQKYGITFKGDEVAITGALLGLLEVFRNWLKVKVGVKFL